MMKTSDIRLLALDLDGTLLNTDKTLSKENRNALKRVIEMGIAVVPTTGRTFMAIPEDVRTMEGIRYAVCSNGAVVVDMERKDILLARGIEKQLALKITDYLSRFDVILDVFLDGKVWTEKRNMHRLVDFHLDEGTKQLIYTTRHTVLNLHRHIEETDFPIERFNLFFRDQKEKETILSGLHEGFPELIVTSSLFQNLEINGAGTDKGSGLAWLCDYLKISRQQVMAVGDNLNDKSMIDYAGIRVVMGNGIPELKEKADYVTGCNDEAGVAGAVKKYLL